ncbi:polysaccharide pyruvyl transferase family protein [Candidimonas sp. SYP-B2681]|uniref:polysaccharide pyruvyl transferase family protein n=1 Tax=Candidimonas sp. SYP-B2681 TaxID=2497686 RepID=UPI000F89C120|nr:polysaccharide pyruvyl transferase family protein [Candidimonas sp. SYP-B2681]RTZ42337.1 polysaccharide pyruvyl transferase family protein [Candidimonas sp. SYP-B2681]
MGKTLFAGEYSSKNVGDGIIKLAIENLCRDNDVEADFKDFFGNPIGETSFTLSHAKPKKNMLKTRLLQSSAVNYLVSILFYFTRYKKIAASYKTEHYAQVVIGGGNLLMDNFLNFPLLILRIVQQCERNAVPVKLFSVGAGKKYSWLARKIVARILKSPAVTSVMCRDDHSCALVKSTVGKPYADKVYSSFDSALYLDRANTPAGSSGTVGLGVIAPSILKTLIPEHPMSDKDYALRWWAGVVESLAAKVGAEKIELLSNGSDLDNEFAHELWESLKHQYPGVSVCTAIKSPVDLMNKIGSYRALAAYRMHAAVTAMALQVPVVGFEWDPKVLHMFTYCGKRDSCVSLAQFPQCSAQDIGAMLLLETPAHIDPIRASLQKDFLFTVNAAMPA